MSVTNIIIIVIIIIVLLWALNNIFLKTNIIYDIMCDASAARDSVSTTLVSNKNMIIAKDIPENNSSNFMLSVWFYIDNWGDNISSEKNILYMASVSEAKTPPALQSNYSGVSTTTSITPSTTGTQITYKNINIALDKYENNLFIDIESTPESAASATNSFDYTRYRLPNVSIQKWNNLTISIDSRTLDVYLDGKLRNSFILKGLYRNYVDATTNKNIYIGNMAPQTTTTSAVVVNSGVNSGFEGFITRIRYESFAINPQEAYNIYKAGINSNLANSIYNRYRLKVSFLEYNKEKGSITI